MKNYSMVIIVLAVILLGAGFFYFSALKPSPANAPSNQITSNSNTINSDKTASHTDNISASSSLSAEIIYNDQGFSPATLTVNKGTTVVFKNEASDSFWPASGVHPTHTLYDGTTLQEHCQNPTATTFDACKAISAGSSWSFTFTKKGNWPFHNHLDPSETGTIIVK